MVKWEYISTTIWLKKDVYNTEKYIVEFLNREGQDGWELLERNNMGSWGDNRELEELWTCLWKRKVDLE